MTVVRNQNVDIQSPRYYHSISKAVRGAFPTANGYEHCIARVEKRLELLANN